MSTPQKFLMTDALWRQEHIFRDMQVDRSCPANSGWPTENSWETGYAYPWDWHSFFPVIRMVGELDISMSVIRPPGITNPEGLSEYRLILKEPVHYPRWIELWRTCTERLKHLLSCRTMPHQSDDYSDIMPDNTDTLVLRYPVYDPTDRTLHTIPATNIHGESIGDPDNIMKFDRALMNFKFGVKHSPTNTKFRGEIRYMNVVAEL